MLGLVVGKFYPPHKGHKFLIDTARRHVDRLVVLLPHHPSQKIPGELRRDWLQEIHPDCEIHLVPDTLDDDPKQWADFTVQHLGRAPDLVFTSESYGDAYARHMNAQHILVDQPRAAVPISATQIRAAPLDHLDWLEPCVRAWFVRRIVLIGAESTGKTTLAQRLADHYNTQWVPEYGREHWEKKIANLPIDGPLPGWSDDEFIQIATEQQRRENLAARTANKLLFCDTNAFATGTWFERYQHRRHPAVDAIGKHDTVHLYLLTHPDIPFVQDGVRDGEKIRHWMHDHFHHQLTKLPTPLIHLKGNLEARMQTATTAINKFLKQTL